VLDLTPDASQVGHHGVEAALLTAIFQALRHHQPQDDIKEKSKTLDEYQQKKRDAHPQHIDVEPIGEPCAHTAEDPFAAAVEPLVVHVLHVRPFTRN
jgi:hypothetical protein